MEEITSHDWAVYRNNEVSCRNCGVEFHKHHEYACPNSFKRQEAPQWKGYERVPLVVDNYAVFPVPKSLNTDPDKAREENLYLFGPESLDAIYCTGAPPALAEKYNIKGQMAWMMFCAPKIAQEVYGYEYGAYRTMTEQWTKQYAWFHLASRLQTQ